MSGGHALKVRGNNGFSCRNIANHLFSSGNKDVYPEDEFLDIPHEQHDQYDAKGVQQTIESDVL